MQLAPPPKTLAFRCLHYNGNSFRFYPVGSKHSWRIYFSPHVTFLYTAFHMQCGFEISKYASNKRKRKYS